MKYVVNIVLVVLVLASVFPVASTAAAIPNVAEVEVTFVVDVPARTPDDARLYVAGSHPRLGDWQPGKIEVPRKGNQGRLTVVLPAGANVEFKFTLGGWDRGELADNGQDRPNRTFRVGTTASTQVCSVVAFKQATNGPAGGHTLTGHIVPHPQFPSKNVSARDVWVYLPPDYDSTESRYPVLYLHDGNNCFDAATAFGGNEWQADETLEKLIRGGTMAPTIVVAIANAASRMEDYTPVADSQGRGGKADAYGRFLVNELKPFVDATYRTKPSAADTGLLGSSLGGLVTLYLGWKHPTVFSRLGVISPSVWWADRWIVDFVAKNKADPKNLRVWLDIGSKEGSDDANHNGVLDAVEDARILRDTLKKLGFDAPTFRFSEIPGGVHNEGAWAQRLPDVLTFLFPAGH